MSSTPAFARLKLLLATPEPPQLSPGPRAAIRSPSELERDFAAAFATVRLPPRSQQLIRSLVLLWHDHLDASHEISQSIETADGSFVHGIMHRREPDYGNAKYWFRRVGRHPSFEQLAARAADVIQPEPGLASRLIRNGEWDAFAFVDACERADANDRMLREVQRIETEVLLERFAGLEG